MKHCSRLVLIGLAALVSLIAFLPAPFALAQGPVDAPNEVPNRLPPLVPMPEVEGGNDPNAGVPEITIPSQGVPEGEADLIIEPLSVGIEQGGNMPSSDTPIPDTHPAFLDDTTSTLDFQVKAVLGEVADQLLERLNGWMHREADQVSDSFNRWLHQEVDRLLASFKQWLAEQLSDTDDAGTIELEPLEG